MNNAVFSKTMENVRKHRDIKLVTTERRKNYLVSEPKYHTTKFFTKNLLALELKETQIIMNKTVYLGFSILDISKSKMYEFWYEYVRPKYNEKVDLCYMDTNSFIDHVITRHLQKSCRGCWIKIQHFKLWSKLTATYRKNEKAVSLMKDELGGQIMKKFVGLQPKT